jgi:hypothetical protein
MEVATALLVPATDKAKKLNAVLNLIGDNTSEKISEENK